MYPQDGIDKFTKKLNKLENNTYVIEEEVTLANGVYEGELKHDNINVSTINVYTGSKLTGEKVKNLIVSTPSSVPWRKSIKIFAGVDKAYITYETQGDTVEADDVNVLQNAIVAIQTELERHKNDLNCHIKNREVDGGSFV